MPSHTSSNPNLPYTLQVDLIRPGDVATGKLFSPLLDKEMIGGEAVNVCIHKPGGGTSVFDPFQLASLEDFLHWQAQLKSRLEPLIRKDRDDRADEGDSAPENIWDQARVKGLELLPRHKWSSDEMLERWDPDLGPKPFLSKDPGTDSHFNLKITVPWDLPESGGFRLAWFLDGILVEYGSPYG